MPQSHMGIRLGFVGLFLLSACDEPAACVDGRVRGTDTTVVRCSTGKIAVCGTDPEILYSPATGALLPTPAEPNLADMMIRAMFDGACPPGIDPICAPALGGAGDECRGAANGTACGDGLVCDRQLCSCTDADDGTACGDGLVCDRGMCSVCRPGCRPRPVCRGATGQTPTCANGETATCLLGRNDVIMTPPPPVDGGPGDAGTDAGDTDAGTDAGDTDAGDTDAGADASADAGP